MTGKIISCKNLEHGRGCFHFKESQDLKYFWNSGKVFLIKAN